MTTLELQIAELVAAAKNQATALTALTAAVQAIATPPAATVDLAPVLDAISKIPAVDLTPVLDAVKAIDDKIGTMPADDSSAS